MSPRHRGTRAALQEPVSLLRCGHTACTPVVHTASARPGNQRPASLPACPMHASRGSCNGLLCHDVLVTLHCPCCLKTKYPELRNQHGSTEPWPRPRLGLGLRLRTLGSHGYGTLAAEGARGGHVPQPEASHIKVVDARSPRGAGAAKPIEEKPDSACACNRRMLRPCCYNRTAF